MGYGMTIQHDGHLNRNQEYFRLNIFGMSRYAKLMYQLGMVHKSHFPAQHEWPEYDETLGDEAEFQHTIACKPLLTRHEGDNPTIPYHKLVSNDGWYVTPDECAAALAVYNSIKDDQRDRIAEETGDIDYWDQWIEYLKRAAEHEGFRVF